MKSPYILLGVLLLGVLCGGSALAQNATKPDAAQRALAQQVLAQSGTTFVENRGQWDPRARYLARTGGLDLWITDNSIHYDFYRTERAPGNGTTGIGERAGHVVRMNFAGTSDGARAAGGRILPGRFNYLTGNKAASAADVPGYQEARINGLYEGIDAVVYFDQGRPRYDLHLAPGADPGRIRISYGGVDRVSVGRDGSLLLATPIGEIRQHDLVAYQIRNGRREEVRSSFKLLPGGEIGFALGSYDRSLPLVIDPLIYSTYLGGTSWDEVTAMATDLGGALYITGFTLSTDFPVIAGSYRVLYGGNISGTPPAGDVFVAKIDPKLSPGSQLVYSTFIGGGEDDVATDIVVDFLGNAYITGVAGPSYPTTLEVTPVTTVGTFATKLPANGNLLTYSVFVADGAPAVEAGIALDAAGRAHVVGSTDGSSFTASAGAFQSTIEDGDDAFVVQLSSTGGITYATLLGGSGDDVATGIALDAGMFYITGYTNSNDFPLVALSAFDSTSNGGTDIFVARVDPSLTGAAQLIYASMIGGSGDDMPGGIAVDNQANIYLTGTTNSPNFPTASAFQGTHGGGDDAFILKLRPGGAVATQLQFGTYLGGGDDEMGNDIVLDASRNAYVVGWTGSATFPRTGNAFDTSFAGGDSSDAFVVKVGTNGNLLYSTLLGGGAGDYANAVALGGANIIHVGGATWSTNFPVSTNAYRGQLNGSGSPDAFVATIGILEISAPELGDTLCAGSVQTLTWTGGTTALYDISISSNGGQTYSPIATNVTGNSFAWPIPIGLPAGSGYRIRIQTAGRPENDITDTFTINTPPIITTQPGSVTQPQGGTAVFTARANGTPTPMVQWEVNNGGGWVPITGATGTTLTLNNVTSAQSGFRYRAVFTNSCASATTTEALLTVSSVIVLFPNGGEKFCAGSAMTIRWQGGETSGPYDLSFSRDGGLTWQTIAAGLTDTQFVWAIPGTLSGDEFRIQVRLATGQAQDVSDNVFTINSAPTIIRQPGSFTAAPGGTAVFTAEARGVPQPTVQWYQVESTGPVLIPGATGTTLTLNDVTQGQSGNRYMAVFMNECDSVETIVATLTVATSSVNGPAGTEGALRLSMTPNPTAGRGWIELELPRASHVRLELTDLRGNAVALLADAPMGAGQQRVALDATGIPSGVYIVNLTAGAERRAIKITVAK